MKDSTHGSLALHSVLGPCSCQWSCCFSSSHGKKRQRNLFKLSCKRFLSTHLQISSRSLVSCLGWPMERAIMLLAVASPAQGITSHCQKSASLLLVFLPTSLERLLDRFLKGLFHLTTRRNLHKDLPILHLYLEG